MEKPVSRTFSFHLLAALHLLILASCASSTRQTGLMIDGLIFRNQSGANVYNVQIHVNKTSAFAECSPVLAGNDCTTTFQAVSYRGNAITISWTQNDQAFKTEEFHAELPEPVIDGKNARVLVIIRRGGIADASLVQ